MNLPRFSISRPVTTVMIFAGVVLFGITEIINFEFIYLAIAFGFSLIVTGEYLKKH